APPGAGKTTRVPLALLEDAPWLEGRRVIVLEPRRLAARAAAGYMAALLGEDVGGRVGYRTRQDTRVSGRTRIEVVTEGVLTRMLQSDAALEGVGAVLFDEFHERSLHADLGLALTLDARSVLRQDLRVLVMSATLDGAAVARLLAEDSQPAPTITTEGRAWPVETRHLRHRREGPAEPAVVRAILEALRRTDDGVAPDILAFLPGAAEIHRVEARLAQAELPGGTRVYPLYGNLPRDVQDRAIAPSPRGERKVVLATSIAETSLTIDGVGTVVDSGLMRVPRFDPRTGMTRLDTVVVTRASADQRRGRAGRLGPGICYRLWTAAEEAALLPRSTPEILEADLAPLALELAGWGVSDPASLRWLDPPPAAAFVQAREILEELGALDDAGTITAHGRRMAELALHPRLAHMVLAALEYGRGALATELAALLAERDILRAPAGERTLSDADVRLRVEALRGADGRGSQRTFRGLTIDRGAAARAAQEARRWRRLLGITEPPRQGRRDESDLDDAGVLLALAYPDRIAQRRPGQSGRFLLRNGRGAALDERQALARHDWIVAAELDAGQGGDSRIYLAAPLELRELERHFGAQVTEETVVAWDEEADAVRARRRRRLGALVLSDAQLPPDPAQATEAVLARVKQRGVGALPWGKEATRLRERLAFLHRLDAAGWPDTSDEALTATVEQWLAPWLGSVRSWSELERVELHAALEALLPWERRRALDTLAPTHIEVPSGSRVPIDYADPDAPVLAVRIQELFGLAETPRIAGGKVPLTLHLLSPARRPVQVTRDLASFWREAYFEVRKDLRGRYPRHPWPDDPTSAQATSRAKRRE
ncbi:MAG TPA: ATP-dependent helicase HrpB, partial [Longimicrobiales bacterium]